MQKPSLKSAFFVLLILTKVANSQLAYHSISPAESPASRLTVESNPSLFERKLFQRNTGMIVGLQKGKSTSIEFGAEAHWRKISLRKPHVIGAVTNLEYNFGDNVVGYKAGMWMKRGRVNLTYGANVSYFTNFKENNRFGIGPSIGFRFVGFHLINGYNFLTKDNSSTDPGSIEVNSLYMSLRYYFPVTNSFTWDRKTMKKKKERQKEKEKRKEEKEKAQQSGDGNSILNIFKSQKKEKAKATEDKKSLFDIFKKKESASQRSKN